jgi:hypothetical protein
MVEPEAVGRWQEAVRQKTALAFRLAGQLMTRTLLRSAL